MNRFFGFDLGDAESAVACLDTDRRREPQILTVAGAKSFITAYAKLLSGRLLIGEQACLAADASVRKLRFKSRFLTDPSSRDDIRAFAAGVLGELNGDGTLIRNEDIRFTVGCPAGWDRNARERYREIFEKIGYPPIKIVSESRAAMISACQSRYLQVGYDILSRPVLVADIGSSTTDFAYISHGREVEMQTAGEVALGGGLMDEKLLDMAVRSSKEEKIIREVFAGNEPWKNYCEFAARRLKERYFSDEAYWKDHECAESVMIHCHGNHLITIKIDQKTAHSLTEEPMERLSGRSFHEVFADSLRAVHAKITGEEPELIFLTGGVSRMEEVRTWCETEFPGAVVIVGSSPEFSVARGLAWSGKIDQELAEFRKETDALKDSDAVEKIVRNHISELYRSMVNTLVEPILKNAAVPVFDRWRNGEISRLSDTEEEMRRETENYLHTDEARDLMAKTITGWLRPVAEELEEYTVPICARHNVPYHALSLKSYLASTDIDVHISARNIFGVDRVTVLIDSIITVIVSILCGGGGIALISGGPAGIVAGAAASVLVLTIGRKPMESALLNAKIPRALRKLVPKSTLENRLREEAGEVKNRFYESLENEKNEEISSRLEEEISSQIEEWITRMAEVVEIPLG